MVIIHSALFLRKAFNKTFEYNGSRIRQWINGMTHAVDQSFLVKSLFVYQLVKIISDLLLILRVADIGSQVIHHLHNLDVGATVFRSLQGSQGCRHNRVCIRPGWSNNMRCECGIITATMFHVQHQSHIQYTCLQFCILLIRPEHHENILSSWQLRRRPMNIHTLFAFVMIIGMITVNSHHRYFTDKHHTLSEYIHFTQVVDTTVIRCQGQNTLHQRIHDITAWCLHNNITHKIRWKCSHTPQHITKLFQFSPVRKTAKHQQIRSFLKAETFLSYRSRNQFPHIVSSVVQAPIAGNFLISTDIKSLNGRNRCQPRYNTIAILVSQTTLYLI